MNRPLATCPKCGHQLPLMAIERDRSGHIPVHYVAEGQLVSQASRGDLCPGSLTTISLRPDVRAAAAGDA